MSLCYLFYFFHISHQYYLYYYSRSSRKRTPSGREKKSITIAAACENVKVQSFSVAVSTHVRMPKDIVGIIITYFDRSRTALL